MVLLRWALTAGIVIWCYVETSSIAVGVCLTLLAIEAEAVAVRVKEQRDLLIKQHQLLMTIVKSQNDTVGTMQHMAEYLWMDQQASPAANVQTAWGVPEPPRRQ